MNRVICIACCLLCLCGCDIGATLVPSGGGGSVSPISVPIQIAGSGEPVTVPLNVAVTVTRTDQTAGVSTSTCQCGCTRDNCNCDCGVSAKIVKVPSSQVSSQSPAETLELVVLDGQLASQLAEADLIAAGINFRRVNDDTVSRPSLRYRGNIASPSEWQSGGSTLDWCLSQVGHARSVQVSRSSPQVQYQPQCQSGFCPLPQSRR